MLQELWAAVRLADELPRTGEAGAEEREYKQSADLLRNVATDLSEERSNLFCDRPGVAVARG